MREDPLDHHRFRDGRDDHELTNAVRAVFEIGIKDLLEHSGLDEAPYSRHSAAPARGHYG